MFKFICAALLLLATSSAADLPSNYRSLSAQQKQALQWNQILDTQYNFSALPTDIPTTHPNVAQLSNATFLMATLETYDDEMPSTGRRTIIDPFAVICKIRFRTFKNSTSQFTGLFHTGGIGIIRLSLNAILLHNLSNFAPNAAVKIYIDGSWSEHMLAVNEPIVGQDDDRNFFRDTLSNIFVAKAIADPDLNKHFLPIRGAFQETIQILPGHALARPCSTRNLGTYETASVNCNGTKVAIVVAPWQILLVPNPALKISQELWRNDFRVNIHNVVKVGMVMYTVYGLRTNESTTQELIGEIVADSECLPSHYGDHIAFFRHPKMQWQP